MPVGSEQKRPRGASDPSRSRGTPRALSWAALFAVLPLVACVGGCRHDDVGIKGNNPQPRQPGQEPAETKVGNGDPSGVDNQPDWNTMADELRGRVGPRLPDPLPPSREAACQGMLDAALRFYRATEPNEDRQGDRVAELTASRERDIAACVESTSVEAAACVTVLLSDRDSEFPWLLDQCMRAYPGSA